MTFVFPVLLGGLLLAGVPILLHLIMRQKPKTLAFPAFRFLVRRQQTNLRKLRLRHLLLLALRILLIVLLCLALGRPRLFNQGLNLNSERPVAAVLVFDTSMSMEYRTSDKSSRLDEARKRGLEFLTELPSGSRVLILDTGDTVVSARGDWLVNMNQARDRIKDLKLRPAAVSALQTLEHAYRCLGELARSKEDDTSRYLPRFVCVFSDRTRACWDRGKLPATQIAADQVPPSLEGLLQARAGVAPLVSLLKDVRKQLPPPAGKDYPEQALIAALELLAPRLPTLTKDDFPPDDKLSAPCETIQRRGRELLPLLAAKDDKKDPRPFREKLVNNLQEVLRDLSGAQGLFVDVGIEQAVDLAITHLELPVQANGQPRQTFNLNEEFVVRAAVQATGKDMSTTLTCMLGEKKMQQPVEVKAGAHQAVHFEINCKDLKAGPHQLEVLVDQPDLLLFNNRRFLTFAIREPPRVLVLRENADSGKAAPFIKALRSLRGDYQVAVEARPPRDLIKMDDLHTFQAVYLFEVPAPDRQTWGSLYDLVQQGLGLGIVPGGEEMNRQSYNQDPAQKVMPGLVGLEITQGKDDGKNQGALWNLEVDNIFQHPLMRPFRAWLDSEVVTRPRGAFAFWDIDIKPHEKEATAIVSYQNVKKYPALVERRLAQEKGRPGKLLLFTTPLDDRKPRWNNYLENSTFVVLVGQATRYLTGETEAKRLNFISGQEVPVLTLPPSGRFLSYALMKGQELAETVTVPERQGSLHLSQADAPGNYVLKGLAEDKEPVAAFSVNVSSEESDLTRVPIPEIESLFGPGAVIAVGRTANIREALKNHWNEPVELFPLFMVMLLVILAVENLLANKFYRHQEPV